MLVVLYANSGRTFRSEHKSAHHPFLLGILVFNSACPLKLSQHSRIPTTFMYYFITFSFKWTLKSCHQLENTKWRKNSDFCLLFAFLYFGNFFNNGNDCILTVFYISTRYCQHIWNLFFNAWCLHQDVTNNFEKISFLFYAVKTVLLNMYRAVEITIGIKSGQKTT